MKGWAIQTLRPAEPVLEVVGPVHRALHWLCLSPGVPQLGFRLSTSDSVISKARVLFLCS